MVCGHVGGKEEQAGITTKSFLQLRITKETMCSKEKGGELRGQCRCVCAYVCVHVFLCSCKERKEHGGCSKWMKVGKSR